MNKYLVFDINEVLGYYYGETPEEAIQEFRADCNAYRRDYGLKVEYDFRTLKATLEGE